MSATYSQMVIYKVNKDEELVNPDEMYRRVHFLKTTSSKCLPFYINIPHWNVGFQREEPVFEDLCVGRPVTFGLQIPMNLGSMLIARIVLGNSS